MVTQRCNFTKNYLIVHLKQVNFMVCKLYLNEAVKKKKSGDWGEFSLGLLTIRLSGQPPATPAHEAACEEATTTAQSLQIQVLGLPGHRAPEGRAGQAS